MRSLELSLYSSAEVRLSFRGSIEILVSLPNVRTSIPGAAQPLASNPSVEKPNDNRNPSIPPKILSRLLRQLSSRRSTDSSGGKSKRQATSAELAPYLPLGMPSILLQVGGREVARLVAWPINLDQIYNLDASFASPFAGGTDLQVMHDARRGLLKRDFEESLT